ncbi:hypothetical protein [Nocardia sp. NPDC057668]|uniref:hypothetical protein n=1 Tax=Nocardia sp. NPDC057668 TaxID=3346202 RepID=UPI00366D2083
MVTVGEQEWEVLAEAAEAAGMSVPDYVSWCVRIQAARAANPRSRRADNVIAARRPATGEDESESAAWVETFSRRCAHHTDRDAEI